MTLAKLTKSKAKTVMGIDASTNAIAYTVFWNRRPIKWGTIKLTGATIYDKIHDARLKAAILAEQYNPDYVAVEGAIMVNSIEVMKKLAYVYGSILGELQAQGAQVIAVAPTTWQYHIGNKPLTKDEKAAIKKATPGRKASWYTSQGRKLRKQRTLDYFNKKFGMNLTDDNVGDSCGIAYYAYWVLTKR
jgi:Holliday junction resolvasome RuvABC endonuclease subunit